MEIIFLIIILILLITTVFEYLRKKNSNSIIEIIIEIIVIAISIIYLLNTTAKNTIVNSIILTLGIVFPIIIKILTYKKINITDIYYNIKLNDNSLETRDFILEKISKHPMNPRWHKRLAKYYEENIQYEKAEEEYFTIIEIEPNNYQTYYDL